jgi:hypothetical protein
VSGYLASFYDPGVEVRDDTPESILRAEQQRLLHMYSVALAARAIPRRVGADATPAETSEDKRICRRIMWVASQSTAAWGGKLTGMKDVSREAAQVNWARWWSDHQTWLSARMRYIATWAIANPQHERWAKSALVKLANEMKWLEYSFRD